MKRMSRTDARGALEALAAMTITHHDLGWQDMAQGLPLAHALNFTAYNAVYILLSNRLRASLITADDQLFERTRTASRAIHLKGLLM